MNRLAVRKAWEAIRKPDVCARPYYVQFEVTTHCNLACYMCVRNEVIKHPRHLAFEDFRRVFDQIRPPTLTLSGAGEPLLNPALAQMIAHASRQGTRTMIPSNGTLLLKGDTENGRSGDAVDAWMRRSVDADAASTLSRSHACTSSVLAASLVEAGLNVLKISIDAATAGTYVAIRRQDCFDKIVEGVRRLGELKKARGTRSPEIRFDVVILKENYAEIPDIVRLACDLDVGTVFFRALQTKGIGSQREEEIGKDMDFDGLARAVRTGIGEAARLKVRTNLKDVARDFEAYRSIYLAQDANMAGQICLLPWLQCFISVKGELSPCCATYTNESFSGGNVFEQPFEAVWNGEKMQALRRQFKSRRNPFAVCRDCLPRSIPVLLKMNSLLPGFVWGRRSRKGACGNCVQPQGE